MRSEQYMTLLPPSYFSLALANRTLPFGQGNLRLVHLWEFQLD